MADNSDFVARVAAELGLPPAGVAATLALLAEGATVPFIARYRKERTGGLDEVAIRAVEDRHGAIKELEERREKVLASVQEQGKLTPALRQQILACDTRAALEDLYLPYRPKRRTKATVARERGLEPLAQLILAQPLKGDVTQEAARFVRPDLEVPDVAAALAGAQDIVVETVVEKMDIRTLVRDTYGQGLLESAAVAKKVAEAGRTRYEDYYSYSEPVTKIPSHRFLAIQRGENEGLLKINIQVDEPSLLARTERLLGLKSGSPFSGLLREAAEEALHKRLGPSMQTDVLGELRTRAHKEAVEVFAENLQNLLMAPPLGAEGVLGVDPGLRTGCKCAAVDATGKFLEHLTIYPFRGDRDKERAALDFLAFVKKYRPRAIAIGNGTAGRETEQFVREVCRGLELIVVMVSEAGASVYSASDLARNEFPELDLTIRGAISIARRLQDPLAELVKVEPKAIGVGQYQHDVDQGLLEKKLGAVVETCVNRVGVELETASAPLLASVAGIGPKLSQNIVAHRETHGAFPDRKSLLKVKGLGPKAFEQAAGFLRVRSSNNPLDRSAVHPERYPLVAQMAQDMGVGLADLVGNSSLAAKIPLQRYLGEGVGEPTLRDIIAELSKPGRDPRRSFEAPQFRDDVRTLEDLQLNMTLEGVVTNVTAFGAFVDIGVHQDGLVHISELADRFIKDPKEVVKVGDRLKVRVLSVDLARKRIALSAKSGGPSAAGPKVAPAARNPGPPSEPAGPLKNRPFAQLAQKPKN